jgi:acyl-CoA thioester hydrolase
MTFEHSVRVRYGEVDLQGIVFNANWLAYFDDAVTRFFDSLGFPPKDTFMGHGEFDFTVVRAVLDWKGPAGLDDEVRITVRPARLGTSSFDLRYTAEVDGRAACEATITYVSVKPGGLSTQPTPDTVRAKLETAMAEDPP